MPEYMMLGAQSAQQEDVGSPVANMEDEMAEKEYAKPDEGGSARPRPVQKTLDIPLSHFVETKPQEGVTIYTQPDRPTVPAAVTPQTPIEELNLNWRERDLPEATRTKHVHRLHPYLGKYIPQLVEIFLRKFFWPGATIYDPFCGSGTTLVQACELGIHSVGCDVSAFNILLCRAKLERYDPTRAAREIRDALARTWKAAVAGTATLSLGEEPREELAATALADDYLTSWFAPQALRELLTFRHAIDTGAYEYKDLLRVILTRAARSARLTTHFDLDFPKHPQTGPYWCYKHSRYCEPTTQAWKFLHRYGHDTARRVAQFQLARKPTETTLHHADSRTVALGRIDGLVTSPPYVGLIDYHEQHNYAYHLLGLEDRREQEIVAAARGASALAKEQYKKAIAAVFAHALEAMPSGARLIVVAGDRSKLYGDIAQIAGVETEAVVKRHVNRRTGRRSNEFYESVYIWRKP